MKKRSEMPTSPPPRKELSDTPVKFCNEIARLFRFRIKETEGWEGVMSQPGARLVMSTLAIHEGINQREVVRLTHLRPPTVSVILQKMETEGLVECRSNPKDLRSVLVYLSDRGRQWDQAHIEQIQRLDAIALRGLEEEELEALMKILPKIRDNLLTEVKTVEQEEKV